MESGIDKQTNRSIRAAVTTYEGLLINQHLGMADHLWIFEIDENGVRMIERRPTPPVGTGDERWQELSGILNDCKVLLTGGIGERPLEILSAKGIKVYEAEGMIEDAFLAIAKGKELRMPHRKASGCRRAGSAFNGDGCG
jgi:nitrogen fixation protein NifB